MAYEQLLLIPGLGETRDLFAGQIAALSGAANCRTAATGRYGDLRMEAGAILAEAPEKFALAGHSMGGYLAFEILRRAPERVTRLALISTRASADTAQQRERREALIAMTEEEGGLDRIGEETWPAFVDRSRLRDERLKATFLRMLFDTGPQRYATQQRAILSRISYWGVLPSIRVPTAVIVGERDMVTPLGGSQAMQAAIAGADLTVIPHCGHLAPLEQPHAVNGALERWLARKPSRRKPQPWLPPAG